MSRIMLIGTICVLLSTMSFGQSKRKWEKTKSSNTITGYENFIKKYPYGEFTELAKQNLEDLTFSIVKRENSIESYESFLQQWKNSSHTSEANQHLDDLYFKKAEAEGTIRSYESFLQQRKNSSHVSEANQRLDDLYFKKAEAEGTIQSYESYLQQWKNSSHISKANQQLDSLYFKKVEVEGTIQSYESFLQQRKNTSYASEVNKRLDSLYFKIAQEEGNIQSYESFLQHRKNSSYSSEVSQRLDKLYGERDWVKVRKTDEISEYEMFLNRYSNSRHVQEAVSRKLELEKQRDEIERLLRKGSVQSLNDFCKKNPDSPYLAEVKNAIQDIEIGRDILDLLDEGKIEIKTQGGGIENVNVSIRKLVSYPINVRVPVGTFFVSTSESAQNMVTTAQRSMLLSDDNWETVNVSAACANRPRDIPGYDDTFTVQRSPHQDELIRLMPVLNKADVNIPSRQAAVWIVTDDADYSDLGTLVSRNIYQSYGGMRVINEAEAARAIKICADAGIDIYSKRIWSDRQEIIEGLSDTRLKNYLKDLEIKQQETAAAITRAKLHLSSEWIEVPAGTFTMGSPTNEADRDNNETQHQVTLSAFRMSRYEVTFEQYDLFCEATDRRKPSDGGWGRGNRPVINVSWDDGTAFAEWMDCRLPTEAEWEYACRAGTTTTFNTGNNITTLQANYNGYFPYNNNENGEFRNKTMPVGSFEPNLWGFYDMHGNIEEWCSDWFGDYPATAQTNPTGPTFGENYVLRGGSWKGDARHCRSAYRKGFSPANSTDLTGFRLVSLQ